MPNFICTTCGTQYADSDQPPAACTICQDERQYVKATGQQWTTLDKLRLTNRNSIKFKEPGLIGIGIDPHFAIGQRALFLRTPTSSPQRGLRGSGLAFDRSAQRFLVVRVMRGHVCIILRGVTILCRVLQYPCLVVIS
jgi:hypothetical protein